VGRLLGPSATSSPFSAYTPAERPAAFSTRRIHFPAGGVFNALLIFACDFGYSRINLLQIVEEQMNIFKNKPWANVVTIMREFSNRNNQEAFANQLEVRMDTVSRWERGESKTDEAEKRKIIENYLFMKKGIPDDFRKYIESVFERPTFPLRLKK
jgi:hypothetical protein